MNRPVCGCHGEVMVVDNSRATGFRCAVDLRRSGAATRARSRQIIEEEIVKRGSCCQDCKIPYEDCIFEWHHRDPKQKDRPVTALLKASPMRLRAELAKCDLLCRNCHGRRHKHLPTGAGRPRVTNDEPTPLFIEFQQLGLLGPEEVAA